jgi:hypothetical protein
MSGGSSIIETEKVSGRVQKAPKKWWPRSSWKEGRAK